MISLVNSYGEELLHRLSLSRAGFLSVHIHQNDCTDNSDNAEDQYEETDRKRSGCILFNSTVLKVLLCCSKSGNTIDDTPETYSSRSAKLASRRSTLPTSVAIVTGSLKLIFFKSINNTPPNEFLHLLLYNNFF